MSSNTEKIAVVMSTKNRATFLNENINSILNQTYENFKLYIIDDNSNDNTCEILDNFQKQDSRICIYKNSETFGPTKNYKKLTQLVNEKYVAHIDDDDIMYPDRLKIQYDFLKHNPEYAFVGSFIDVEVDNNMIVYNWVKETDYNILKFCMLFFNPFCHSSIMFNNEIFTQNNINYDTNYTYAADYDLYFQAIAKNCKFCNVPQTLVKFKQHSQSITGKSQSVAIQVHCAKLIRNKLLCLCGYSSDEAEELISNIIKFPYSDFDICEIQKFAKQIGQKAIENSYCSNEAVTHFFELLNKFAQRKTNNFFEIYE